MAAPKPDDLKDLGKRLDAIEGERAARTKRPPQTSLSIAFRFSTELVAALIVGGAIGWGIDWAADRWSPVHTRPWGLIVFFVFGAAAGILNVMRAAREINAQVAKKD
jgi:ATP synthase protein I